MKLKNVLMISFLAIAGIFGASSAIVNNEVKETPVVEKAEALGNQEYIYLLPGYYTDEGTFPAAYFYSGGSNRWYWMEQVEVFYNGGSNYVYRVKQTDTNYGTVIFVRMKAGATELNWDNRAYSNQSPDLGISSATSNTWSVSSWGWNSTNVWVVTHQERINGSDGTSFTKNVWSDYTYPAPSQEAKYGYTSGGWFTNSGCTTGYSSKKMTADTTIYSKYTSKATKTVYFDPGSLSSTYSTPHIYAWESETLRNADWPGVPMTKRSTTIKSIYGGFVWTATIPNDANVIFSPGGDDGKTGTQSSSSITSGNTFLINTLGVGNWYTNITVSFVNQDTSTTTYYYAYKDGSEPIGFVTPVLSKSGYDACWNTAPDGGGTDYGQNTAIPGFTTDTPLYSKFTTATYTVTYNRNNGESAPTEEATKTRGTPLTIANPTSFSWTPSDMKYFKYWNTDEHDSDSGTRYNAGASYITEAGTTLYYIEDYWEFQVKVGSDGSWTSMQYDEGGGLPSGVKGQFTPVSSITLTSGKLLYFQVNKHDGNNWQNISFTYSGDGNNYNESGIILSSSGIVDLKIKNDGTYDVWVPGLSVCTVQVGGVSYSTIVNGDQFETVNGVVEAKTGDTVKIAFGGTPIAKTYMTGGTEGCFTSDPDEGTVTCVLTGRYTIYVVRSEYTYQHEVVSIVRNDSLTANYLASIFNSGVLDGTCNTSGNTDPATLKTAWDTAAAHFTSQPSAIKSLFTDSSEDAYVSRMMSMYRYIIQKYGTSVASDFLGKGYTKGAIRNFSPYSMIDGEDGGDNATTIIIVIAASVSLLSITALSILLVKKRKRVDN